MNKLAAISIVALLLILPLIPFGAARAASGLPALPPVKGDAYFWGYFEHETSTLWEEYYWQFSSPVPNVITLGNSISYIQYEYQDATGIYLLIWGSISYSGGNFYWDYGYHPSGTGSIIVNRVSNPTVYAAGSLSGYGASTSTKATITTKCIINDNGYRLISGGVLITLSGTLYKVTGEGWSPVGTATRSFMFTSITPGYSSEFYAYPTYAD